MKVAPVAAEMLANDVPMPDSAVTVVPKSIPAEASARKRISSKFESSFRDGAKHQTSDAQLRAGESRDSGFDASHRPE